MNIYVILKGLKKKVPGKNEFYSSLSGKGISDKERQHLLKVWNKFEMKTMKDYCDLYLKFDVLLLADVSYISKRLSKINNKYLTSYDATKLRKYTTCLDNNYTVMLCQNLF